MAKRSADRHRKRVQGPPGEPPHTGSSADPGFSAAPDHHPGLECRECGCTAFRVACTWRVSGGIRRMRVCLNPNCGAEARTLELLAD